MNLRATVSVATREWFAAGKNVAQTTREVFPDEPAQEIIEAAYDLQAGSYTSALSDPSVAQSKAEWGVRLAGIMQELGINSVCEAGVGEATTLAYLADASPSLRYSGFDISLSRLLFGRQLLNQRKHACSLFCADLVHVPLPNACVDVVLTNHSLEPNGGRERESLTELLRVCRRYLVLVEPDYDRALPEQKSRMEQHHYVRHLADHLSRLPGRLVRYEDWPINPNPLNKASLFVFEKDGGPAAEFSYVSPVNKLPLHPLKGYLYSKEEGLLYPTFADIPVLRDSAAIICSHADL